MVKKAVRTISGVTIVAVMTKPWKCPHGRCVYCPGGVEMDTPQSYMPKSPVVLRAKRCDFDPFKQVQGRLRVLGVMGHPTNKIELIVMGGTFLAMSLGYQKRFIKECYDGINGAASKNLTQAIKINETAKRRCVGLCIETRPDWCGKKEIKRMLSFGVTRVELGVQLPSDRIYKKVKRKHTVKDVVKATQLLKDSGLKVHYHYMVNLPGSNIKKDIRYFEKLFADQKFRPDGLKIYPCLVLQGTELEKWYHQGKYEPYKTHELSDLIIKLKQTVPKYVRISRIMRDIPAEYIVGGTKHSHIRDIVKRKMSDENKKCNCIRCREVGYKMLQGKEVDGNSVGLCRMDYKASEGKEIFLSSEDTKNNILIGLLRLRIPYEPFMPQIKSDTAIIRELHVFGPEAEIGEKNKKAIQHRGHGKKLLAEAEGIARNFGCKKIAVTSGIGAREYYRKLGYKLEQPYVVKKLN